MSSHDSASPESPSEDDPGSEVHTHTTTVRGTPGLYQATSPVVMQGEKVDRCRG